MDNKQAAIRANQKTNEEAHHKAHWMANYMAHQSDGMHSPQGLEALSATIWKPRLRSGTAQSGPRDNKEVQRAKRKANGGPTTKPTGRPTKRPRHPKTYKSATGPRVSLAWMTSSVLPRRPNMTSTTLQTRMVHLMEARTMSGSRPSLPWEI